MLPHAIKSTSATEPSTTRSEVRVSPISASISLIAAGRIVSACWNWDIPLPDSAQSLADPDPPRATVAAGLHPSEHAQEMRCPDCWCLDSVSFGSSSTASVVQMPFVGSADREAEGRWHDADHGIKITAETNSRPTIDWSAPNCDSHSAWLIRTTRVPSFLFVWSEIRGRVPDGSRAPSSKSQETTCGIHVQRPLLSRQSEGSVVIGNQMFERVVLRSASRRNRDSKRHWTAGLCEFTDCASISRSG